jgi:6-phosphogluconolactonase
MAGETRLRQRTKADLPLAIIEGLTRSAHYAGRTMPTEVCDSSLLASLAAQRIAEALKRSIALTGAASLALAGGTTPRAAYEALSKLVGIDWARINVYFGDERAVPATDPDSNFQMAQVALFERVLLPTANIHRMHGDQADQDAAARDYEALLPGRISVMVLGIGEDGHTASLFPGSPALHERVRRVLPVVGPKPPPRRLSVTPPVIESAEACIVLAAGAGKAEPVRRALCDTPDVHTTPACLARSGLWLLDRAAAALLAGSAAPAPLG